MKFCTSFSIEDKVSGINQHCPTRGITMEEEDYHEEEMEAEEDNEEQKSATSKVFLPGGQDTEEQELVHDKSAYYMYHNAQTGAPCLSFDILKDSLGESRVDYPMTAYIVGGTQAERGKQNYIVVMKMSNLCSTFKEKGNDDEEEEEEEEELDDDNEPQLDTVMIQHPSTINRLRIAPVSTRSIVSTWSETGKVHLWDVTKHALLLDTPTTTTTGIRGGVGGANGAMKGYKEKPLFTFNGHRVEGYAIDWSDRVTGRLATGDINGKIHLWSTHEGGTWVVDETPYSAHIKSVEDIQWSPNEDTVFSSCSVDGTIRIWDCRAVHNKANMITVTKAHDSDINVIHWNNTSPYIVSGGDDGILKVWDLRLMQRGPNSSSSAAVAVIKHHTQPITSVEWHPTDSTVFASAGADDQIVQWDLSVEKDETSQETESDLENIPPQLLFIHQGQQEIKELHWHSQLPGVMISTAHSGFNIFKTISV